MNHFIHQLHEHKHKLGCGHTAIQHSNHIDYIHDGHLHHEHEEHYDECVLEVSASYPIECTNGHDCDSHSKEHVHGPNCGHEAIPHGDHIDYLVGNHLHHYHAGHCDFHGKIELVGV